MSAAGASSAPAPTTPPPAREVMRRFLENVWNARNLDLFPTYVSPRVLFHPPRGPARDYAQYLAMAREFMGGFSDLRFEVAEVIGEGPHAAARLVIAGTNDGPFRGHPASGRRVRVVGQPWCRVEEGRIVEFRQLFDELGMLHQLGRVTDASLFGHAPPTDAASPSR